jgi:kumamolisin
VRSRVNSCLPITLAAVLLLGAVVASPVGPADHGGDLAPIAPVSTVPLGTAAPALASSGRPVEVAPAFTTSTGVTSLGAVPISTSLEVAVGLPSRDPAGLASFVAAASVPGTAGYRAYLSSGQAEQRFGASPEAIGAARAYFAGFGLPATTNPDGLLLYVSGPAARIGAAFDTTFDEYRSSSGRTFVSHPTPATLPGSLGTSGVFGLGNVTPLTPSAALVPEFAPAPDVACTGPSGGLTPCAIARAYNITPLETNGTTGHGTSIAVVDAYASNEGQTQLTTDLAEFAADSSIPVGNVSYLYPVPTTADLNASGTNIDWAFEDALDLEWARATAPGATVDMTFSPNPDAGLYDAVDWLVSEDAVNVVSMSWGEPDTGIFNAFDTPCSSACNATTDGSYEILGPVLQLGAAEGITFFAASGDCGSADGTSGVATNFPASDPYVTGVGGTDLTVSANDTYAGEIAWSGNSTGASSPGCQNQGGSGGGYAPFPEPWWQSSITDPGHSRGVPDVALDAADPVAVVVDGGSTGVSGTSVGTPIWAGIAALADQYAGQDLGLLNPSLYDILRGSSYDRDFHDITLGTNGYSAGPGWDPVTGIGSPNVGLLIPGLVRGGALSGGGLSTSIYASPRSGHVPLTVDFALNASGGRGTYPLEGVSFGDGGSALTSGGVVSHTYSVAGDYLAQSFVSDGSGNTSTSLPVLVAVGGGAISVALSASITTPSVGGSVTLSAVANGGTPPYSFQFYFGDDGSTGPGEASVDHVYQVAGGFCAEVVAVDSANPADAGVSPRVAITVGGATGADCADGASPFTVASNTSVPARDAPADYDQSLFTTSGGASAPDGLTPATSLVSNDTYIAACGCEIFRHAGNYTVTEWANDTVDGSANATRNVSVAPALDATFAASTLYGPAPLKVYFFSSTHGGYEADANLTDWTFGNGASAVGHSVNETYANPGEYLAFGRLSDRGEGNGSEAFLIDVTPVSSNTPLGVVATMTPVTNIASGTSVRFTATVAGPSSETNGAEVNWNLGDGRSAFGNNVAETYYGPLPSGSNNTLSGGVTVETSYLQTLYTVGFHFPSFFALEAGGYVPRTNALVVTTNVTPSENLVPFSIFGNASASGPHPISISWVFGDGTTGTGSQVEHAVYGAQGYSVETIATDGFGDVGTLLSGVTANGPLGIAGTPSPGEGPKPLTVTIAAQGYGGKGPPYQYEWTFVNGTHSRNPTVTMLFPDIGTYVVRVNVSDRSGAMAERNFTIVVDYPYPYAALEILGGGTALGALIAVVFLRTKGPRKGKAYDEPWLDHPRTASDGTPVW